MCVSYLLVAQALSKRFRKVVNFVHSVLPNGRHRPFNYESQLTPVLDRSRPTALHHVGHQFRNEPNELLHQSNCQY